MAFKAQRESLRERPVSDSLFMLKCSYDFVGTEYTVRWIWDEQKNAINKRKHHLSFETAALVFNDPLAASRRDLYEEEERWQTIGQVGPVIILVVHTTPKPDATGEETGRIISARKATAHERKAYEETGF